jgi:peptidoglycan biosynthesis protein MviN/MurJ (putative lipid II flippase)
MGVVVLNITLNAALVWPLGELALAISTSLCAMIQCVALAWRVGVRPQSPAGKEVIPSLLRCTLCSAAMLLIGQQVLVFLSGSMNVVGSVAGTILICTAIYALLIWYAERGWLRKLVGFHGG